jgi:uncharacterized protein YndB with AHSA1/START domain
MAKSELSVIINALPEKVFARISDPNAALEDIPNVVEVKDINGEGLGQSQQLTYKMMGIPFNVKCEYTEYIPGQRLVVKCSGGIDCIMTWTLEPQDNSTKVNITSEYSVPVPLVGKIAELILKKQNEREWESVLGNLKARVEAQASA